jgi:hypothetical protein
VEIGDEVEVELEFDPEPRVVAEPADLARALGADPIARAAYDRLPDGRKREHVRAIESAKKPETRTRRLEKALAALRGSKPAWRAAAPGRTRASKSLSDESRAGRSWRRRLRARPRDGDVGADDRAPHRAQLDGAHAGIAGRLDAIEPALEQAETASHNTK